MTEPASTTLKSRLPDYFLLALVLFSVYGVVILGMPLLGPVLAAVVIGISFFPLHQRLRHFFRKRRPWVPALLTDLIVLCFLIVPTALLIWVMTNEAQSLAPTLKSWQTTYTHLKEGNGGDVMGPLRPIREWLSATLGVQPAQFRHELVALADTALQHVTQSGGEIAKNSFRVLFALLVMMFTLFFIFRDGVRMTQGFLTYLPLDTDVKLELADRLHSTIIGVIRGWFLTSLVQGLTAALGYFIIGTPAVALFGALTALTGLIPSVGTALVWLPIAVVYLAKGLLFKGIFLMVWGILIVGLLDNFLRPYLMKNKSELPFLALFLAILGGIEVWGFMGIVIGPILVAITPIIAEAYRHRFLNDRHTPAENKAA
jgi:predicted PurR-regulated permease PerM